MAALTIGLNHTSSNNRIRFEKLSQRLQKVNIDILHKAHSTTSNLEESNNNIDTNNDIINSYFYDELEQCGKLETSRTFRKFQWEISKLVQSLPELLHHQNKVVDMIIIQMQSVNTNDLQSYFNLLSVLARDLKSDLQPHFQKLMQTFLKIVNSVAYSTDASKGLTAVNPELTGKMFECISHLLRAQWDILCEDPDVLRQYYGPFLASSTYFIRDFSAKSFTIITRKLSNKAFKIHFRKIIYALSSNCQAFITSNDRSECNEFQFQCHSLDQIDIYSNQTHIHQNISKSINNNQDKKLFELYEGVSLLLFYTCKGVKGNMHSKAIDRLHILFSFLIPIPKTLQDTVREEILKIQSKKISKNLTKVQNRKQKEQITSVTTTPSNVDTALVEYNELNENIRIEIELLLRSNENSSWRIYSLGKILSFSMVKLFRHINPSNLKDLWIVIIKGTTLLRDALNLCKLITNIPVLFQKNLYVSLSFMLEILFFGIQHSNGRGVHHKSTLKAIGDDLISISLDMCELCLCNNLLNPLKPSVTATTTAAMELSASMPSYIIDRCRLYFCSLWKRFPTHTILVSRIDKLLKHALPVMIPSPAVIIYAQELLPHLSYSIVQRHLLHPLLAVLSEYCVLQTPNQLPTHTSATASTTSSTNANIDDKEVGTWLSTLLEVLMKIHDYREDYSESIHQLIGSNDKNNTLNDNKVATAAAVKVDLRNNALDEIDSWNASSDSDNESQSSSSSTASSDPSEEMDEKLGNDVMNKQLSLYKYSSKSALSVLLQDSENIKSLATKCFNLVKDHTEHIITCISKNRNNDMIELQPSHSIILAMKCLLWFMNCTPQVLFNHLTIEKQIKSLYSLILKEFSNIQHLIIFNKINPLLFTSDTIILTSIIIDYKQEQYNDDKNKLLLKEFCKSILDLLSLNPNSISLTFAINVLLSKIPLKLINKNFIDKNEMNDDSVLNNKILMHILNDQKQLELIKTIGNSLKTASYWLRYNWLRILSYLPNAKLKIDEETNISTENSTLKSKTYTNNDNDNNMNNKKKTQVDISRICLEAISLPLDIRNEREFTRRIGILEVLVRGNRLSLEYIHLICGFCLGILNIKFKPVWDASVQVLVSAAKSMDGESVLWPLLLQTIEYITSYIEYSELVHTDNNNNNIQLSLIEISNPVYDSGIKSISITTMYSNVFIYKAIKSNDQIVEPDARTDLETLCTTVWNVLKISPNITLKRSKVIVGFFLNFLTNQYYQGFPDEPEIPYLKKLGLFSLSISNDINNNNNINNNILSLKILKKRLDVFLQVFSVVTSPKQLYLHNFLYLYYHEIMSKSDVTTVKLAFECILTYKSSSILPYKDNIKRLLEDKTIRDELVNFNVGSLLSLKNQDADCDVDSLVVREEHRMEFIPFLIRTIYGRFTSKSRGNKSDRELNMARRVAVLSFISKMDPIEMRHLLHLMIRGIIPKQKLIDITSIQDPNQNLNINHSMLLSEQLHQWYDQIDKILICDFYPTCYNEEGIPWERLIGFLHLMQPIIKILGYSITQYIPIIHKVILVMLTFAHESKYKMQILISNNNNHIELDIEEHVDDEEEVEANDIASSYKTANQALKVRSLALLRIAELIDQYHSVYNFTNNSDEFFDSLQSLTIALPSAISSCRTSCPAMLRILHSLSQYQETISILTQHDEIVSTIIKCIASPQAYPEVMRYVLDILHALLDYNEGNSIHPHADLVIRSFSKRFVGSSYEESRELKLSEMNITPTGSVKIELKLLCRIASGMFQRTEIVIAPQLVTNLSILLLGMLRTYTTSRRIRVEQDWVIDILQIYQNLLWRVGDITHHIPFINRLFGPASHSYSLFNTSAVRMQLVDVLKTLNLHPSIKQMLHLSYNAMNEITSEDPNLIGSKDFNRFVPIFQSLSCEEPSTMHALSTDRISSYTWYNILGPGLLDRAIELKVTIDDFVGPRHISLYSAVLYECLRCMYDNELVVRSSAIAALKVLVTHCILWNSNEVISSNQHSQVSWLDILKSIIIPAIHRGFKQSTDVIKRGFIMLLSHLIRNIYMNESTIPDIAINEMYHVDLWTLLNEDPEQDFFENITHIQIHRRVRAMMKLRNILILNNNVSSAHTNLLVISASSYNNLLLPLVYHFLFSIEFSKKDHISLMQESSLFLGGIGLHLQWNHYYNSMKTILKQLEKRNIDKEKILLNALCCLLDSFHFDLSGTKAANILHNLPDRQGLISQIENNIPTNRNIMKETNSKLKQQQKDKINESITDHNSDHEDDINEEDNDENEDINNEEVGNADIEMQQQQYDDLIDNTILNAEIANDLEQNNNITTTIIDKEKEEELPINIKIAQILVNNIIPWVQIFLLKDGKDHKGNKMQTVQPHVALALTKIIHRLEEPVVSAHYRNHLFVNLIIRVVSTLQSKDTSCRDIARDCLAKMITTLGLISLKAVLYELQYMLKEGFQRHVCNYTVRTILRITLQNYVPNINAPSVPLDQLDQLDKLKIETILPEFDQSIPLIMQSVLDDLNGTAQDDREADEALRSLIREAKGSKANDILEITAKCLLFRPTYALVSLDNPESISSIHAVTTPLLNILQEPYQKQFGDVVGRVAEGLQRVALGLSKNPSLESKELLLYLHSTLQPYVAAITKDFMIRKDALGKLTKSSTIGTKRKDLIQQNDDEEDFDALDEALPSYLREESSDDDERALYSMKKSRKDNDNVTGYKASTWLPSERKSLLEQRAVIEARNREAKERIQVLDGASAPKLTGYNKHMQPNMKSKVFNALQGTGGDRATIVAIRFCLTLLYSCIRHNKIDHTNAIVQSMIIPFLPLLGKCIQLSHASNITSLAIRCLTTFIGWGIPVESNFLTALGNRLLKLMFRGGGLISTETELAQACTKGLSSLFKIYNTKMNIYNEYKQKLKNEKRNSFDKMKEIDIKNNDEVLSEKPIVPITLDNLRALVQMITVSIMEVTSSFQTVAFQLVREIIATKLLLPEIYDLITKLAEQIVLSQRKGVRDAASSIVITFIISYPLGEKRVSSQLRQLINNCNYEYEEGRCSALNALILLIKTLPLQVLEDYSQMIFLPITLRIVNDKSANCREKASAVIIGLIRKVSNDTVLQFQDFVLKWLMISYQQPILNNSNIININQKDINLLNPQNKTLIRTGAQIAGLIIQARPDICKKDGIITKLIQILYYYLYILLHTMIHKSQHRNSSLTIREMSLFDEGKGEIGRADSDWVLIYHLLGLLEQLYLHLPAATDYAVTHLITTTTPYTITSMNKNNSINKMMNENNIQNSLHNNPLLMELIQESLLFPHAWVRSVSSRVLLLYLNRRDVMKSRLYASLDGIEILTIPNSLYQLARRICIVLNQPSMTNTMLNSIVSSIVFVIRAMLHNPQLNQIPINDTKSNLNADCDDDEVEVDIGNDDEYIDEDNIEDMDEIENNKQLLDEEIQYNSWNKAIELVNNASLLIPDDNEEEEDNNEVDEDEDAVVVKNNNSMELNHRKDMDLVEDNNIQNSISHISHITNTNDATNTSTTTSYINEDNSLVETATTTINNVAHWVMQRLRGIGADSRGNRRLHILKVFILLAQKESIDNIRMHIEPMIEIAIRAIISINTTPSITNSTIVITKEHANQLLQELEMKLTSSVFIGIYSNIQRRIENSKNEKKRKLAAEAILEPKLYAERKISNMMKKKQIKKRQTLKHTAIKGLKKKVSRSEIY